MTQQTKTATKNQTRLAHPKQYQVLLHNDDFTPRDFVIGVIQIVFNKSFDDALRLMLHVHTNGVGVVGIYNFEIAETKVNLVHQLAQEQGFPLLCTLEEA